MQVGIVTTVHNRLEYVKQFAKTIKETLLSRVISYGQSTLVEHWIVDDGSSDPAILPLLYDLEKTCPWIRPLYRRVPLGVDRSVLTAIYQILSTKGVDILVVLDSDMIVKPNWLSRMLEVWPQLDNPGALSAFNCAKHTIGGEVLPGVVTKASLGGASLMVDAQWLRELDLLGRWTPRWGKDIPGWDWVFTEECAKAGKRLYALTPSLAQHIGILGAHSPNTGHPHDVAEDWICDS